jgi:hypothetical protein
MKKQRIKFKILFRSPKYPVIVISQEKLLTGYNIDTLSMALLSVSPPSEKEYVKVIDFTGEEFWFFPDKIYLTPGFFSKKWTKKKVIELYNNSSNAKKSNSNYPLKSLSSKKFSRIIGEICELLSSYQWHG